MKPFVVIQLREHDEVADSEFFAICRYAELDPSKVVRIRAEQKGIPFIDLDQISGIIVGGSPFDISDEEAKKSAVQKKLEAQFMKLLTALEARDFPFLGACSGNGLLGSYCGVSISTKYGEPVGGADVRVTEEGQKDPLLQGLPERFRVLLGHKEACDEVPARATLLVAGDQCPVQMFRVGQNLYATQFHPEGDAEGFKLRVQAYAQNGYFPPETASELKLSLENETAPESNEILRRFVARYQR